ncbi:Hypothetical_protein [Hexamita inflata]|uniref:Hypothetical_protein n=1 Tax=Hexamita inflata TaxID=28002 RepID=A0AA86NY11_9EUKA|nr:Hypothetical protein HINF_LOCUS14870 [Hexamita inflata]
MNISDLQYNTLRQQQHKQVVYYVTDNTSQFSFDNICSDTKEQIKKYEICFENLLPICRFQSKLFHHLCASAHQSFSHSFTYNQTDKLQLQTIGQRVIEESSDCEFDTSNVLISSLLDLQ